jgi:hypothetical protein
MIRIRLAVLCGVAAALLAAPAAASAQVSIRDPGLRGRTHVGVGYAVNLPRQMFGLHGVVMSPGFGGWGLYADYKKTTGPIEDDPLFEPGITVEQAIAFNDFPLTEESEWESFNFAVVRIMSPALALYAGAGRSEETVYRRFFDETEARGTSGVYWAEDPRVSGTRLNVLGGAMFRAHQNFLFHFGVESAPTGATVGVTLLLPFFQ